MSAVARSTELAEFSWSQGGSVGDIVPHDANPNAWHGLYVGTGGDVAVEKWQGQAQIFKNVPSGTFMAISVKKVLSTGTDALNILGLKEG